MLGRLWRRWRLRRSGQVFCYFDGQRKRYGDPLQLWRAFVHHPANLPALAPAVDEQKEPETTQFIQGVCEVFGLTRYDPLSGVGLTDAEVLMTLESFHAYLEAVKKKAGLGST
jgi:hypothetical protein